MDLPSRNEIVEITQRMLSGALTRSAVSEWACTWVVDGNCRVSDYEAWDAIVLLGAADMISTDRPYLYNEEDFVEMMKTLKPVGNG
jgi:hypothetical protein